MNGVLIWAMIIIAGIGPFIAVHVGGRSFDFDDEAEPETCTDDTIELPRVRARIDPEMR